MTPALEIQKADVFYGNFPALLDVNVCIERRQFVTIAGPNGGGKTTLFRLMLGLVRPTRGWVRVLGMPPEKARLSMGYVPQSVHFDPLFPVRVCDVVRMGCLGDPALRGWGRTRMVRQRVLDALVSVGLEDLADRWFSTLSGGQRQRVLIARALAGNPELLLLDEPTSNVDISAEDKIIEVLESLRGRMTVVLVTHYPKVAARFLDSVYCVNRRVHAHPTTKVMDDDLMRHITGLAAPAIFAANEKGV